MLRKPSYEEIIAALTKAGGPFEIERTSEAATGRSVRNFVNRPNNLGVLLDMAEQFEQRECIVYGDARLSYEQFIDAVRRCAAGLLKYLDEGDRIGVLGANHPSWMIAFWGALYAGLTPVALNGWWRAEELVHGINLSGCKFIIGDAKCLSKLENRWDQAPNIQSIYCWDNDQLCEKGWLHFETLTGEGLSAAIGVDENAPAVLLFSSGTTGRAKAALISHGAWVAGLMNAKLATEVAIAQDPSLRTADIDVRVLASLPFFHVAGGHGLVVGGVAGGSCIVIPEGRFEPALTLDLIEREKITRWSAVPTMVRQVCDVDDEKTRDLSALTTLGYGAAPSAHILQSDAMKRFPAVKAISNAYGLTETGGIFAMNTGEDFKERPYSVGRAFATAEIRIVNSKDQPLDLREFGELQVRGPFLMREYWNDAEATGGIFTEDGWLRTGDLGRLDGDGFVYIEGRKKDIIIRGGENILAEEVERQLELHPDIVEAAVFAEPSEILGEEVRAIIRTQRGANVSAEDARAWIAQSLAHFKVPSFVDVTEKPLPRNAAGKILKTVLRGDANVIFDELL